MTTNRWKESTLGELVESNEFGFFSNYFFSNMTEDVWNRKLKEYGFEKCGMEETFERLTMLKEKTECLIQIYSPEEIKTEPDKEEVRLIAMPVEKKTDLPYVIVCPGGGYARQWGLIEGLAIGARLNRMGYPAFVLYYRTAQKPLLPKPMEDLAGAVRYLEAHAQKWGIKKSVYAVAGFSAGAHLAAEWGTETEGYRKYQLPAPELLILGYPAIATDNFMDQLQKAENMFNALQEKETGGRLTNEQKKEKKEAETVIASTGNFLERLGGPGYTRESLRRYSIDLQMDDNYPPVYLIACEDDPIVPIESGKRMERSLKQHRIPCRIRIEEFGGHSFGVGNGQPSEGWLEDAVAFWKTEQEKS